MLHIKDNYYIQTDEEMYVLLARLFDERMHRYVFETIGEYSSMKEAIDAVIKEIIKKEVNQKDTIPLHEIVCIMKRKYKEFYEQMGRSHMNFV